MWKEVLAVSGGIIVGVAICYGGYRIYKHMSTTKKKSNFFAEKVQQKAKEKQKFDELLTTQTHVELLTATELTTWFKENKGKYNEETQMLIVTPTIEHMRGLGYPSVNNLDENKNILQLFYDEKVGVVECRLVNFSNIETNLEANLIEQEGMIVVTE